MSSHAATVISHMYRVGFSENKKNVKGTTLNGAVVALKSPCQLSWQQAVIRVVNIKQISYNRRIY
jgi:hypothetical protein